jgi:hypothetical protein
MGLAHLKLNSFPFPLICILGFALLDFEIVFNLGRNNFGK